MNFPEIDLTIIHVFKKCDDGVNKCYWDINYDSTLFYTNFDPRDEVKTLDNVMRITKLRQQRTKLVDDYFKCC
jgi:type 1 glutamine amidotransferase